RRRGWSQGGALGDGSAWEEHNEGAASEFHVARGARACLGRCVRVLVAALPRGVAVKGQACWVCLHGFALGPFGSVGADRCLVLCPELDASCWRYREPAASAGRIGLCS